MTRQSNIFPASASATGNLIIVGGTALQVLSNTSQDSHIATTQLTGWGVSGTAMHTGIPVGSVIILDWLVAFIASEQGTATLTATLQGSSSPLNYNSTPQAQFVGAAASIGQVITGGQWPVSWSLAPSGTNSIPFGLFWVRSQLTYSPPPNAPTLNTPATGLFDGLSPTFSVTASNPTGGDTITHTQYQVRRVSNQASMWDSAWISGTSSPYGGTALTANVQYEWRARNRNEHNAEGPWSAWRSFTPSPNTAPTATAIGPSGDVGTSTPNIQFSYSDPNGDTFAHYQIQVRRQSDQVSMWDTGQTTTNSGQKSALQVNLTYAGDALANGTQYQWRARVWDDRGAASNYTAWQSFRPVLTPGAPTLSTPSGLQTTLTPQITGSYNTGSGGDEQAYQYQIRQGSTTIYDSGWVTGNIATGQAYGTNNPSDTPSTPPALAWGTSYSIRLRSQDDSDTASPWTDWVAFRTHGVATTPTNLSPSGSITSDTTPTLSWTHNDPEGHAQTAVQIELEEVGGSAVSGYDPKTLEQSGTTHTVTETLTISPATTYRWRVRTRGLTAAGYGPYSDWRTFIVSTSATVTLTAPTASQDLSGPSFVAEWTFSGGTGTQQDFRVRVYASDQTTIVYDSGLQSGDATEWTVPPGSLRNGNTYYVQVTARDTNDLVGESDMVLITTSWALPDTITGLIVSPVGSQASGTNDTGAQAPLPYAYLQWDESAESLDTFLRYVIYRRHNGGEWLELAHINNRANNSYRDYGVASDTVYEYTVTQVIDTSGEEVESEQPAPMGTSVIMRSFFIHSTLNPAIYVEIQGELHDAETDAVGFVQPFSVEYPVAHVSPARDATYSLTAHESWQARRDIWEAIEALRAEQVRGAHLLLRQMRAHAYVVMTSRSREHGPVLYTPTIEMRAVRHPEGVN